MASRRLMIVLFFLAVAGALLIGGLVHATAVGGDRAAIEERLAQETAAGAALLAGAWTDDRAALEANARRLAKILDLHVTIFDAEGRALAEFGHGEDFPVPESRTDLPEVADALRSGSGRAVRYSQEAADDVLHLARRIQQGARTAGVLRLSLTRSRLLALTGSHALEVALLVFLPLAGLLLAGAALTRHMSEGFGRLRTETERLLIEASAGEVESLPGDELDDLVRPLQQVRGVLTERMAQLDTDHALTGSVLASMREGVLVVDPGQRVLLLNTSAQDLLNLPRGDLSGRPLVEVTRHTAVTGAFRKVIEGQLPVERKFRVESGVERHLELRVVPLRGPGGDRLGALGVIFDITRLEVLESVRRTFIANVSHELRTPLASIKAYTETLLQDPLEDHDHAKGFLEVVLRQAGRMEALVDDLTDLSLIESGAVHLDADDVDLGALVEDVIDSLEQKAENRDVTLVSDIPERLTVQGDRMRLEQVLVNVIDNAVKFGPEGGKVQVRGRREERRSTLTVEDEGPGIPEADLAKIFHRFHRVDKARSRELGGTGLGLSIVKHLMRLHGGSVRAENREDGGARLVLEFPAQKGPLQGEGAQLDR